MKRIMLFIAIIVFALPMIGQSQNTLMTNERKYFSDYIPTPLIDSLHIPLDSIDFAPTYYFTNIWFNRDENPVEAGYGFVQSDTGPFETEEEILKMIPKGFAQRMHTDTMLSIGGIALITEIWNPTFTQWVQYVTNHHDTIQILDYNTKNVIYEKVLDDDFTSLQHLGEAPWFDYGYHYFGYYNIIFDSAVNITGDYLIAYKYNPDNIVQNKLIYSFSLMCYMSIRWDRNDLYFDNVANLQTRLIESGYDYKTYLYNYEVNWLDVNDFSTHYSLITNLGRYSINTVQDSPLTYFDESRKRYQYTTDLVLFLIPEAALDSIDRPTNSFTLIPMEIPIEVSPNPTKGEVVISCPEPLREVALLNPMGQVLYRENYNQKRITLDLSSYPQGVYILKIQTPSGEVKKKVVRQ